MIYTIHMANDVDSFILFLFLNIFLFDRELTCGFDRVHSKCFKITNFSRHRLQKKLEKKTV
jgi:hypothetical protein